jgi:hypothetical protein
MTSDFALGAHHHLVLGLELGRVTGCCAVPGFSAASLTRVHQVGAGESRAPRAMVFRLISGGHETRTELEDLFATDDIRASHHLAVEAARAQ